MVSKVIQGLAMALCLHLLKGMVSLMIFITMSSSAPATDLLDLASPCGGLILRAEMVHGSRPANFSSAGITGNDILRWFGNPTVNPERLIKFMSLDPYLDEQLNQEQLGWIGEHTLRVMKVFLSQRQFLKLPDNYMAILMLTLGFHDMGKPAAIRAGSKHWQKDYTAQVTQEYLSRWGIPEWERSLIVKLVENDPIGELLEGKISVATAARIVRTECRDTGLSLELWWKLRVAYYTSDAASYPKIRRRIFKETNGFLEVNQPRFSELKAILQIP